MAKVKKQRRQISKETESAVIGYWRGGAPIEQICVITDLFYPVVKRIIEDYKKV